jgi:CheY-like chemotaxis protein
LALLAGRKLLLADDSITIQKVVALTFADEGVEVVTVSDGQEAIEKLQGSIPDIVLADVFMPEVNGYEVCRYIKQNAKLKHIPVMLLVGSFEPFDEAEARRVGADDILTKPFQSIRRLIDKVGGLLGSKRANEATTAELPHVQEAAAEPEKLSTEELEITTADTQPLPVAMEHPDFPTPEPAEAVQEPAYDLAVQEPAYDLAVQEPAYDLYEPALEAEAPMSAIPEKLRESEIMDSPSNESRNEKPPDSDDVLLDLGDIGGTSTSASDDFVLDLDFDESESAHAAEPALSTAWMDTSGLANRQSGRPSSGEESTPKTDQRLVDTQEWKRENARSTSDLSSQGTAARPDESVDAARSGGSVRLDQLSPEIIEAIARRAVEQLSARVVEEIAWEVVPQLAELLIKRKLEENQSQPK